MQPTELQELFRATSEVEKCSPRDQVLAILKQALLLAGKWPAP